MATTFHYARSPFGAAKRLKLSAAPLVSRRSQATTSTPASEYFEMLRDQKIDLDKLSKSITPGFHNTSPEIPTPPPPPLSHLPRNIQALYLRPLRRTATHGIPIADLQLRCFSLQPLQHFADFALRAAYYLGIPVRGPVPLPRITQRWTVPRSNFIFKKSQENFERITLRRLLQVQDADAEVVRIWLGVLRRYAMPGVGMKANVWSFEHVDFAAGMDERVKGVEGAVREQWEHVFNDMGAEEEGVEEDEEPQGGFSLAEMLNVKKESTEEKARRMMEGEEGLVDESEGGPSNVERAEEGLLSEAEKREREIDEQIEKQKQEEQAKDREKKGG